MNISQVSEQLGISSHTLRYYEKLGLLRGIKRSGGRRVYFEEDIVWLEFIMRLKATGMPLSKIKEYSELRHIGGETVSERKEMLLEHKGNIKQDIEKLQSCLLMLDKKIEIYGKMEKKNEQVRKRSGKTRGN